jgi:carbon monoxide dehydrogenase subunit G
MQERSNSMARFEETVVIKRPIEEVFAFVTDLNNSGTWQSGVLEARMTSPGPIAPGSRYVYTMQLFGRRVETTGEITAYEPPTKYGYKATSGPFPLAGGANLERVEGGTRVTWVAEAEPGGFFALAAPVIIRMAQRQIQGDLNNLKDILEAQAE